MNKNKVKIQDISKNFGGVKAVNHLDLSFNSGEITGLIGPNGSGKTTLINLLTGIFPFDTGLVILGDDLKVSKNEISPHSHDGKISFLRTSRFSTGSTLLSSTGKTTAFPDPLSPRKIHSDKNSGVILRSIKAHEISTYGMTRTFQDVKLFGQMSVLDNVLITLTEKNVWSALFEKHRDWHIEEAEKVLKRVGLYEKRDDLAENLSYGQRKLLEVARALATKADVYFFDEPFAGLFPEMAKLLSEVMIELKNAGKTVILVEHNMDLIRKLSDRVIILDSGELLAEGNPEQALSKPEVLEAYLGE